MTRQQNTVIWLGLVIVALNLLLNVSQIKSVIFKGSGGSSNSGGGSFLNPGPGSSFLPGLNLTLPFTIANNSASTPSNVQVV